MWTGQLSGTFDCLLIWHPHSSVYVDGHLVLCTAGNRGRVGRVGLGLPGWTRFRWLAVDLGRCELLLAHHVIARKAHHLGQQVEEGDLEGDDAESLEDDDQKVGLFLRELHEPLRVISHLGRLAPVLDLPVARHAGAHLGAAHEVRAALIVVRAVLTQQHQWDATVVLPVVVVASNTEAAGIHALTFGEQALALCRGVTWCANQALLNNCGIHGHREAGSFQNSVGK